MSAGLYRVISHQRDYLADFTAALGLADRPDISPILNELCSSRAELSTTLNTDVVVRSVRALARDLVNKLSVSPLRFSNHMAWLETRGYSREQKRQIRFVVESFYLMEPMVLATVLTIISSLCSVRSSAPIPSVTRQPLCAPPGDAIEYAKLPSDHPISVRWRGLVPAFFEALSVWPDYLDLVWSELSGQLKAAEYIKAVSSVTKQLNVMEQDSIGCCGWRSTGPESIGVRYLMQYASSSCEVVVIIGALRKMFTRAEVAERRRRCSESTTGETVQFFGNRSLRAER